MFTHYNIMGSVSDKQNLRFGDSKIFKINYIFHQIWIMQCSFGSYNFFNLFLTKGPSLNPFGQICLKYFCVQVYL